MIPKFRIWDKIDREIIHVDGIDFERKTVRTADVVVPFAECVLMQSTGLFDKNGVEIFEGDVVRHVNTLAPHTETGTVEYFADWAMFGLKLKRFDVPNALFFNGVADHISLEVLGNVWENPELVEVEHA